MESMVKAASPRFAKTPTSKGIVDSLRRHDPSLCNVVVKDWQQLACNSICNGKFTYCLANTGAGKSMVIRLLLEAIKVSREQKFLVVLAPVKGLQSDLHITLKPHFPTLVLNGDTKDKTILQRFCKGEKGVYIMSVEMFTHNNEIKNVTCQQWWIDRCLAFIADEAHTIVTWGNFRVELGNMASLSKTLSTVVPFLFMSATMTTKVFRSVRSSFSTALLPEQVIDATTRRAGFILSVAPMISGLNTGYDAIAALSDNFFTICGLLPVGADSTLKPEEVGQQDTDSFGKERTSLGPRRTLKTLSRTIIYVPTVRLATELVAVLRLLVPADDSFRIVAFHGQTSSKERTEILERFTQGQYRIIVGTEACGLGCNLPGVRQIIILGQVPEASSLAQRAGRCSRGRARDEQEDDLPTGTVLYLVPFEAFGSITLKPGTHQQSGFGKPCKALANSIAARQRQFNESPALHNIVNGLTDAYMISDMDKEATYPNISKIRCIQQILEKEHHPACQAEVEASGGTWTTSTVDRPENIAEIDCCGWCRHRVELTLNEKFKKEGKPTRKTSLELELERRTSRITMVQQLLDAHRVKLFGSVCSASVSYKVVSIPKTLQSCRDSLRLSLKNWLSSVLADPRKKSSPSWHIMTLYDIDEICKKAGHWIGMIAKGSVDDNNLLQRVYELCHWEREESDLQQGFLVVLKVWAIETIPKIKEEKQAKAAAKVAAKAVTKDAGKAAPDAGKAAPDAGKAAPDAGKAAQEAGKEAEAALQKEPKATGTEGETSQQKIQPKGREMANRKQTAGLARPALGKKSENVEASNKVASAQKQGGKGGLKKVEPKRIESENPYDRIYKKRDRALRHERA